MVALLPPPFIIRATVIEFACVVVIAEPTAGEKALGLVLDAPIGADVATPEYSCTWRKHWKKQLVIVIVCEPEEALATTVTPEFPAELPTVIGVSGVPALSVNPTVEMDDEPHIIRPLGLLTPVTVH